MPNQCEEETENRVPKIIVKINIKPKGNLENIRRRINSNYPKQS